LTQIITQLSPERGVLEHLRASLIQERCVSSNSSTAASVCACVASDVTHPPPNESRVV